jgi:hypothetical protein
MKKKFISILITLLMVLSLLGANSVFASDTINYEISNAPTQSTLSSNSTDSSYTICSGKIVISLKNKTTSSANGSSAMSASELGYIALAYNLSANTTNRTVTHSFTITDIGGVPTTLSITQYLSKADHLNGLELQKVASLSVNWSIGDIYVGNSKSITTSIDTGFYTLKGLDSALFLDGGAAMNPWSDSPVLLNRTANFFPDYTDPYTGKKASTGIYTSWAKTSNPVDWNNTIRDALRNQFNSTYGAHWGDWSGYQLHHIQPRALGGTNDISNIIPLPTSQHYAVSGWFNGYSSTSTSSDPVTE